MQRKQFRKSKHNGRKQTLSSPFILRKTAPDTKYDVIAVRPLKAYMRRGTAPMSLTGVLDGGEFSTSRPGCFTARNH